MLFQMGSAHRKVVLHSALRDTQDGRDLLDAPVFEVEKGDGGLLLLRKPVHGPVELLVPEGGVGRLDGREVQGIVDGRLFRLGLPAMVNITIVCDPEEPGAEFGQAQERAGRHDNCMRS